MKKPTVLVSHEWRFMPWNNISSDCSIGLQKILLLKKLKWT